MKKLIPENQMQATKVKLMDAIKKNYDFKEKVILEKHCADQ